MTRIPSMDYDDLVRATIAMGVPRDVAERAAADEITRRSCETPIASLVATGTMVAPVYAPPDRRPTAHVSRSSKTIVHVGADRFAVCRATIDREFDTLRAVFNLPPRTKKNSRRFLFKESVAYSRYREAIKAAVAEANDELRPERGIFLPMPDQAYNLAAIFYVDSPGQQADIFGLLQGIADALQDAGVVRDDWWFRTTDGSRVVAGDDHPRVELTISPLED